MLWNTSVIIGYAIEANDGKLGTVSDLLFDDSGWIIRWLVVDTGHWLPGRKVLLPLSVLGKPDSRLGHFPVQLTMQRVIDSPDVNTDQPVSRQIEAQVHDHFGWDPYWSSNSSAMSNAIATPFTVLLYEPEFVENRLSDAVASSIDGDPHLRSITTTIGSYVDASDGEIGHVDGFLVDDIGWNIRYIKIDTKNWWPGQ